MGMVLWIDQNTFATTLVEKVFKKKDLAFYGLTHARDFAYLVDDLIPEVIVIDTLTISEDLAIFKAQYEASQKMQKTPFIFIGKDATLDFIQIKLGEIDRPFDPFEIPKKISTFLNKLS